MTHPACPVCGAVGSVCVGAGGWSGTAVDIPTSVRRPDVADQKPPAKARYEIPVRGHTTTVKLTPDEANELYGDQAKRVGSVKRAEPQPVGEPPYAQEVPPAGESTVPTDDGDRAAKRRAPTANKARGADDK